MHYMTTDSPTRGIEGSVGYSRKQCLRDMPALRWDAARTVRFMMFGWIFHAPGCHLFYGLIDRSVYLAHPYPSPIARMQRPSRSND